MQARKQKNKETQSKQRLRTLPRPRRCAEKYKDCRLLSPRVGGCSRQLATPAGLDWDAPPAVLPQLVSPHTCTASFSLLLPISSHLHFRLFASLITVILPKNARLVIQTVVLPCITIIAKAVSRRRLGRIADQLPRACNTLQVVGVSCSLCPVYKITLFSANPESLQRLPLLPPLPEDSSKEDHTKPKDNHATNHVQARWLRLVRFIW